MTGSTSSTQGGTGQESGNQGGAQQTGQESGQGAAGQGQESTQQQQQGQQQSGTESGAEGFDLSSIQDPALRAYLEAQQAAARDARQEAARYRTERNSLQEAEQQRQREAETEQERANREATERQERLDTLERENRSLRVGSALATAAQGAKAHNAERVAAILEPQVTLDSQGKPENIAALLTELRQSDPYLFARVDQGGGEGGGHEQQPTGSMNDRIRSAIQSRRSGGTSS